MSNVAELYKRFRGSFTVLYGPPGVGKTSFLASYKKIGILATDTGCRWLGPEKVISTYLFGARGWQDFRTDVGSARIKFAGRHFLAIDTIDQLYQNCVQEVCRQAGIKEPSSGKQGNGWVLVDKEFTEGMLELANHCAATDTGLILTSHARSETVLFMGEEYAKIEPTMPTQCERLVWKITDWAWYLGFEVGSGLRVMPKGSKVETPTNQRKKHDLRVTAQNRVLVMNSGELYRTKMRQDERLTAAGLQLFPPEIRQLQPTGQFDRIFQLYVEGMEATSNTNKEAE